MSNDLYTFFKTKEPGALVPERYSLAIMHLSEAHHFALGFECEVWQFALNILSLRDFGITENDCRWLLCGEFVDHGIETSLVADNCRTFRLSKHNAFSSRSCFVLTEKGVNLAEDIAKGFGTKNNNNPISTHPWQTLETSAALLKPVWHEPQQELHLGDQLVKKFKLPARNQAAILSAFQEENWISRIDDPLPPKPGRDPKRRLHDTINSLNRNQKNALIRFYGDGSGTGVCWKLSH